MKSFIFVLCFFIAVIAQAEKVYDDHIKCEIIAVYDGDTVRVNIPSYPKIIGENIRVRLKGINTDEMGDDEAADLAGDFVRAKVAIGKKIELRKLSRDKFFRLLAELWVDNKNIADELLEAGLAKQWNGQGVKPVIGK
jgi:endonuclease YncB( thermonuclease family)